MFKLQSCNILIIQQQLKYNNVIAYSSLLALLYFLLAFLLLCSGDTGFTDYNVLEDIVQFFIFADGGENVVRDEPLRWLVVLAGFSLLEDLLNDLLEDCGKINRCFTRYPLCVSSFLEMTVYPSDREDEACAAWAALRLSWFCCWCWHFVMRSGDNTKIGRIDMIYIIVLR